ADIRSDPCRKARPSAVSYTTPVDTINIQAGGKRDATGITGAGREYPRTCHDKKDPRHETSFQDCTSPMFASRKIAGSRLCTLIES
ncbi:hypothetical protein ACC778_35670, partial [Rhizobium ruizarguesonis]